MEVTVTNKDVTNLNKFMLNHSKSAKKQRFFSTYAIPFEFILVGIITDTLLKFSPFTTIISTILAALWLIYFPKFYNKNIEKNIKKVENLNLSDSKMNFIVEDNKISFSPDTTPKPSEIFDISLLKRIVCTDENYFLGFDKSVHIVLPKTDEIAQIAQSLSQKQNIKIENVEI